MATVSGNSLRVLFVSDTHIGIDMPMNPRVERRRRGEDFLNNFRRALAPVFRGEADVVVHGGDLLFRSKIPPRIVQTALEPLLETAQSGVPVYLVPGNHERSAIPYPMLAKQSGLFIFDRPRVFLLEKNGFRVALAGFPYLRRGIREAFPGVLEETGWSRAEAEVKLLCMHHVVEGAELLTLRGGRFVFSNQPDVIKAGDIPSGFCAVLSGHIHRCQVLTRDLTGREIAAPVFYAGSVERTSLQEMREEKCYLMLNLVRNERGEAVLGKWRGVRLPARPMWFREWTGEPGTNTAEELDRRLTELLALAPADAVLTIRLTGAWPMDAVSAVLAPERLRRLAPGMNIEMQLPRPINAGKTVFS